MKFVAKLEKDNEPRNNFIAEMVAANMFEAKLMHLWWKINCEIIRFIQNLNCTT